MVVLLTIISFNFPTPSLLQNKTVSLKNQNAQTRKTAVFVRQDEMAEFHSGKGVFSMSYIRHKPDVRLFYHIYPASANPICR